MEGTVSESLVVMPVERKDGTYALRLCLNQGLLTLGMTRRLTEVMEKFELSDLRATNGQRMNLEGIPKDKIDQVVAALGTSVPKCPPGVSVCPGNEFCKFGMRETRALGDRLLEVVKKNGPYPYKVKSGVSGCKMACGLSYVRDIGFVAGAGGWDVWFGGCATRKAGLGVLLGSGLTEDAALEIVAKALAYYKENGKKRERTSGLLRRIGEETLLAVIQ